MKKTDLYFMQKALTLGAKGTNLVSPNPRVGCVVVKNGKIVGRGYHKKCGADHAEIEALRQAAGKAAGSTVYVTLEPCTHTGRTPACAPRLKEVGVSRVVIGTLDRSLKKSSVSYLRKKGIEVCVGVLEEKAKELIKDFDCYMQKKRPFITVKCALSLDGKIATSSGKSRWISSARAGKYAMRLRANSDAVLIGAHTANTDNPRLTYRLKEPLAKQPLRVVVDGKLSIREDLKIIAKNTLVLTTAAASKNKKKRIEKKGAEVKSLASEGGVITSSDVLEELYSRGLASLLVEGGGETVWNFIKDKKIDKLILIYGSLVIGGRDAPTACDGEGFDTLSEAQGLRNIKRFTLGESFVVEGELN